MLLPLLSLLLPFLSALEIMSGSLTPLSPLPHKPVMAGDQAWVPPVCLPMSFWCCDDTARDLHPTESPANYPRVPFPPAYWPGISPTPQRALPGQAAMPTSKAAAVRAAAEVAAVEAAAAAKAAGAEAAGAAGQKTPGQLEQKRRGQSGQKVQGRRWQRGCRQQGGDQGQSLCHS